jgi:hypothetical protein
MLPLLLSDEMAGLMAFVDGENFTLRGQKAASDNGVKLVEGKYWKPDTYLWFSGREATLMVNDHRTTRSYYYTSVQGDRVALDGTREALWQLGFTAEVFTKPAGRPSKGVDITLARDMLSGTFLSNFHSAFLYAGDGDYVPLVEEVKRHGKLVHVCFFEGSNLSDELRRKADFFHDVTPMFTTCWAELNKTGQ